MIKQSILTLAAVVVTLTITACNRNSSSQPSPTAMASSSPTAGQVSGTVDHSHSGSPLPAFRFNDPSGKQLAIPSLKGKPTLINLWATWCGPCVAEMPTLDKLAADHGGALRVVTISQDAPGAPVSDFIASHGFKHLEPWLDPEGKIDYHYATGHFPTTVYYDADGREVWRYVGARDWSDADTPAMLVEGTLR